MTMISIKTYEELISFSTFEERLFYLSSIRPVGELTFGHNRYLNQTFYRSSLWKRTRNGVIVRDYGCDLAFPGFEINDFIVIHHMNPLTIEDIENETEFLTDPRFLITTCKRTHQAIHYGEDTKYWTTPERKKDDHILWKRSSYG